MEKVKNNNLLRWILLVPALLVTGLVSFWVLEYIAHYSFALYKSIMEPNFCVWFVSSAIPMFFVARYIAPKHKNLIAGLLSVLLAPILVWGLLYVLSLFAYSF